MFSSISLKLWPPSRGYCIFTVIWINTKFIFYIIWFLTNSYYYKLIILLIWKEKLTWTILFIKTTFSFNHSRTRWFVIGSILNSLEFMYTGGWSCNNSQSTQSGCWRLWLPRRNSLSLASWILALCLSTRYTCRWNSNWRGTASTASSSRCWYCFFNILKQSLPMI